MAQVGKILGTVKVVQGRTEPRRFHPENPEVYGSVSGAKLLISILMNRELNHFQKKTGSWRKSPLECCLPSRGKKDGPAVFCFISAFKFNTSDHGKGPDMLKPSLDRKTNVGSFQYISFTSYTIYYLLELLDV
ncbi:hypothetical protein RUM44_003601 [Polyplax serrata]|uniref:Uncharacterized protein n=1 Tax=Polyplax serrata TaxID=468196 RepID=A0ABR1AH30_POLSC